MKSLEGQTESYLNIRIVPSLFFFYLTSPTGRWVCIASFYDIVGRTRPRPSLNITSSASRLEFVPSPVRFSKYALQGEFSSSSCTAAASPVFGPTLRNHFPKLNQEERERMGERERERESRIERKRASADVTITKGWEDRSIRSISSRRCTQYVMR